MRLSKRTSVDQFSFPSLCTNLLLKMLLHGIFPFRALFFMVVIKQDFPYLQLKLGLFLDLNQSPQKRSLYLFGLKVIIDYYPIVCRVMT